MGIGWKPDRMAGWTDPERARLNREPEERVEETVDVQGREAPLEAAERSLTVQWREELSCEQFVAALRALADALSQDQNFRFAVDHRFIYMRPQGRPSMEYREREDQRKEVTLRFTWEA